MSRKKTILWFCAVGLFCLLALAFLILPGYSFSGLICLDIGGILFLYYLFWRFQGSVTRWLRRILSAVLIAGMALASVTGVYIAHAAAGTKDARCDCLIVLGAAVHGNVPSLSLRERLDAAYDYLVVHPETVCVVSGGQGSGEQITEAECMYNYLTGRGIPAQRILRENRATSTGENLAFSLELLATSGIEPECIGIVSSEYHLYRASLIARSQGVDPILIPASTSWISLRVNYFLREIVAVWYYTLLGG